MPRSQQQTANRTGPKPGKDLGCSAPVCSCSASWLNALGPPIAQGILSTRALIQRENDLPWMGRSLE